MLYLGIDPGLSGALAMYRPEPFFLHVEDIPTFKIGKKSVIDHLGLARIIDHLVGSIEPDVRCWLEFVSASPQMGVTSAFNFGEGYGIVQGVLAAHFLRVEKVTPASWKRAMKVTGDKDECRAAASRLFPEQSALFARKKDDGRAEAALLAVYGAREAARARA